MGDEGGVMKLLLEMMTYLDEHVTRMDESADPCAASSAEPAQPEASRSETSQPWDEDEDDYSPPPRPAALVQARCRQREERRRVLRLAGEKLALIEERERTFRKEKDLRRQLLLQNMAGRLEAEARSERAARQAARRGAGRSYSRTLGRSFCSRPAVAAAPAPAPAPAAAAASPLYPALEPAAPDATAIPASALTAPALGSISPPRCQTPFGDLGPAAGAPLRPPERRKRRRPEPPDDPLAADELRELLGEPALTLVDDDDEPLGKRLRLLGETDGAEPGCGGRVAPPAPQDQVRFGAELGGCGAAAGFADMFQHAFQLVPSLES